MDVNHSVLVSNHVNWMIGYKDSQPPKETCLSLVTSLIGGTIAWPVFFLGGALILTRHSISYIKARWNQYKIINILSNPKKLQEYSEKRDQYCENQIKYLMSKAIFLVRKLKSPPESIFPIPQNNGSLGHLSSENYLKNFSWNEFLKTNFFHKSIFPNCSDKITLQQLEQVRTKINYLTLQQLVLSCPNEKLEAIKKIAQMSFVKNAFIRQDSKEWIFRSSLWLIPSGVFWETYFNTTNNRLTYEDNKNFLPVGTDLEIYDDLIDAHNKLVGYNNFLVPYIRDKII